jgi:hypothetical protein
MPLPCITTPVRAQGRDAELWDLEWTFTDGSGSVLLDSDQSCLDARVATPVADGGSGITTVRFPKCKRAWVNFVGLEPATEGTAANYRQVAVVSLLPTSGSCEVRYVAANGGALSDPESLSRMRLTLRLEY